MAKEETVKLTPKDGVKPEDINALSGAIPQDGKPLTKEQVSVYINQLEDRLRRASAMLKEMKKELELYQMQDYYQRAQLLCVIISNNNIGEQFRSMCEEELKLLVYPPKEEPKQEK